MLPTTNTRIGSIDAIRAIILLGILVVHANTSFGFKVDYTSNFFDNILFNGINIFLAHKCAIVFNIMFGVSFYFILKKPSYPSSKFAWRCVLLFFFGLFNKLFYTYDALCLYAVWGGVLVLFRNFKPRYLLISAVLLRILAIILSQFKFGDALIALTDTRYSLDYSLGNVITYPHALLDYCKSSLNGGIVGCLSNFLIGYFIAKIGVIERLKDVATFKNLSILFFTFIVVLALNIPFSQLRYLLTLAGGFFYATLILYTYYNVNVLYKPLHYLEAYGKLGLTNYSMQGIFGVTFVCLFKNTIVVQHISLLLFATLTFYVIQAIFSHKWLETHKFGPLEYVWRSLTSMNFSGNKK